MLTIKRTTLLPISCYYGISVLAKNEAVLISIPRYMIFSVYRPTLAHIIITVMYFASLEFSDKANIIRKHPGCKKIVLGYYFLVKISHLQNSMNLCLG